MTHYPLRFVVCTYNLWNDERWPDRRPALTAFLTHHQPDILSTQELRPITRQTVDETLPTHRRIEDSFEGWAWEGNIYWHAGLFELLEYGAEEIGIIEELRRLFWVRLRCRENSGARPGRSFLVATAHYTWRGNRMETEQGLNPRLDQARRTVEALNRLAPEPEPLLFMGDLNDSMHPIHILRQAGLVDSFTALGRQPVSTWPALPLNPGPPELDDWIFHRGPLRPMTSEAVEFFLGDLPPSDHKPLLATYRWSDRTP